MPSRRAIACAVVLFWALCCVLPASSNAAELILRRGPGLSAGQRADLRARAGVTHKRTLTVRDAELVTVPDASARRALAALNGDPRVIYAAPNARLRLAATGTTTDPYLPFQWDLEQGNDADIDITPAWAKLGDAPPMVNVGVVDTQVQNHVDLFEHVDRELSTDLVGDTTCTATAPVIDHGTHIAGTVAAIRGNGTGIAGIAPTARIVPIRAFDYCGTGTLGSVLEAFQYAGDEHIPIVVASFATDPLDQSAAPEINRAFADLIDRYEETLFVVAAGNEGSDNGELPVYPCDTRAPGSRTDPPNLMCVASSDKSDTPTCTSNVGGSVDVFAPGEQLFSTTVTGVVAGWTAMSGTSMSAAVVAGVAALANAQDPGLVGSDLKTRLMNSVDRFPGMQSWAGSGGRINAAYALGVARGGLGSGGPGGVYRSCDPDHDSFVGATDQCPEVAGTVSGCLDVDGDGVRDDQDNCPGLANTDQANLDGDAFGDACDPDQDGDAKVEALDACPRQYALTPSGCPAPVVPTPTPTPSTTPLPVVSAVTPAPTPVVTPPRLAPVALRVKLAVRTARHVTRVMVKPNRTATFAMRVEQRVRKRWKRIVKRSLSAGTAGRVMTLKRLATGSYRVTATARGVKQAKRFRVL